MAAPWRPVSSGKFLDFRRAKVAEEFLGNEGELIIERALLTFRARAAYSASAKRKRKSNVQYFFEDHQIIATIRVPANADDVVAARDRQVQHQADLGVAFKSNGFVLDLFVPLMNRLHQL